MVADKLKDSAAVTKINPNTTLIGSGSQAQ